MILAKLLCLIGLHKWRVVKRKTETVIGSVTEKARYCQRCPKQQRQYRYVDPLYGWCRDWYTPREVD